jgi:hypothetical protein
VRTFDTREVKLELCKPGWLFGFLNAPRAKAVLSIPATVGGNTAQVGFTAGTGFETAQQEILSWTFANPQK